MNISETLKRSAKILEQNGIAEPRREANSLLAFFLQKDKVFLIAHSGYELTPDEEKQFSTILERRANREPFQHITGKQEFYGLDFFVSKDVLIPRPETEIIVENAIEILRETKDPRICEIGIGSGCISVSILHENANAKAFSFDISENALQIAEKNARFHGVFDRIFLEKSDVFENIKDKDFDLIVSNPPYIPQSDFDDLQPEVRDFDPQIALTDGKDGLSIIAKIIERSPDFLKPKGHILIEIGIDQANSVKKMFSPEIWQSVEFISDLQNIPRTVRARKY